MTPERWLRLGFALVGVHLIATLAPGAVANIWPPRTGEVIWRIVFSTQLFNGLGLTLAGLTLLTLVGFLGRSRGLVAGAMGASVLVVLLSGALALLLLLDFFQFRPTIRPDTRVQWDLSVLVPIASGAIVSGCLLVVAMAGRAVLKQLGRTSARRRSEDAGQRIVVGR